jgi:hypothetical protein
MCVSFTAAYPRTLSNIQLDAKVAPDSDHLDSEVQIRRKRKVSKAASEKQKMAAKKRAKKRKDDGGDDYGDNEDEYTTLSKSLWKRKTVNAKPSIGSLEKCAKCSKRFTVVRSSVVFGEHLIIINNNFITIITTKSMCDLFVCQMYFLLSTCRKALKSAKKFEKSLWSC